MKIFCKNVIIFKQFMSNSSYTYRMKGKFIFLNTEFDGEA
jgi:hypothetical protein